MWKCAARLGNKPDIHEYSSGKTVMKGKSRSAEAKRRPLNTGATDNARREMKVAGQWAVAGEVHLRKPNGLEI